MMKAQATAVPGAGLTPPERRNRIDPVPQRRGHRNATGLDDVQPAGTRRTR
jgi:hypothetical protein